MKRVIPLLFLLPAFMSSSCRKWQPENRIVGDWKLIDVEKRRFLDFDNITTGYENGIFSFYDNGTAEYKEGTLTMNGNWMIRTRNYGDDDNVETALTLRLYNFSANRIIDWQFDNISFGIPGKKMRCFITRGRPNYRYLFERQ